ncbi:MAG TPA: hypothetical protein VM100_06240, partial [Longimicrobiales bacterium]|nr:hypothetical protein [Longimicrobiales bacterium]
SGRISVRHTSIPLETSTSDDILAVVAPPVITATVPTVISSSADTVWIRGGGFTGAIVEGAAKFNVVSDSLIWTLLNQGACSGRIDVTNAGVALSSDTIHTTMRVTSISPAHVKTGNATAANVWTTKLFGSCLSVDEVVFAGLGKDIVLPQSNDNMYLAPSGEWIALKKVPAGAVSGPVKVRRNGRNKLEAISSDTLFIDDVPPPPRSPVDCESSCFEARVTGAQNTLLNGSAAVEVDAGSGAAGDFNIVLRKRDDGGNYISFMRTTNGGRPRAGVTYALANSCDEEAAENNKPDQFTAEYWVNAFHEGPGVRYASKAGTFTINEITKDHIIGQFAFTACHFKDDGTREQIHARGNFNALWPH